MSKSVLMRVPNPDGIEILAIAKEYRISMGSAWQIWKRKKFNPIKWRPI